MKSHSDPEIAARSQEMLMAAGYEPKADWLFIGDLVQQYRQQYSGREDRVTELDRLLASGEPVTRADFARFSAGVLQRESVQRTVAQQRARVLAVCANAGVIEPEAGHEALALRIIELERAVQSYAGRLQSAERTAAERKSGPAFPFLAGVVIGGIMF